jgi:hypothetical protein
MYENKTIGETKLQSRVFAADLTPQDYQNLFYQLWGACSCHTSTWEVFERITAHYLTDKAKREAKNEKPIQ